MLSKSIARGRAPGTRPARPTRPAYPRPGAVSEPPQSELRFQSAEVRAALPRLPPNFPALDFAAVSQAILDEPPIEPSAAPETVFPAGLGPSCELGPACEKCGRPNDLAACPYCGWYPVLGIHVELDEAYEAAMNGTQAAVAGDAASTAAAKPGWQKHLEVWRGLVPWWAWLMIGTSLACVAIGVVARIATLNNPTLQTWCGVGGLVGGLLIALVAHVVAFLLCSFEDATFGVADIIVKPLKTWKLIASRLPQAFGSPTSATSDCRWRCRRR